MTPRRIRSKQHIKKRRAARLRKLQLYTGGIVAVLALIVGLTHLNAVQITDITITTEDDVSDQVVEEQVAESISRRWLGMVARDNILLLPRGDIRSDVRGISARIDDVDISLTGLRGVAITVTNRDPVARACGSTVSNTDQNDEPRGTTTSAVEDSASRECYLVDSSGTLFILSDSDETDELLSYQIDTPLRAGTELLPPDVFRSVRAFVAALEGIDLDPQEVVIQEGGDLEIPVTDADAGTSTDRVDLRVSMYKDLEQTAANLQTVIANRSFVAEGSNGDEPADTVSPFSLEYIDMRFDNKVFYK